MNQEHHRKEDRQEVPVLTEPPSILVRHTDGALQSTKPRGEHMAPSCALRPEGRASYPDVQPPHCALGIAAAVFSWTRRNRWQSHRGSGKAVDIQASGKGWRHRTWCSGSSAARLETECQATTPSRLSPEQQIRHQLRLHLPTALLTLPSHKPTGPARSALCLHNLLAPAPPVRSLRRWPCPHHIVLGPPAPIRLPTTKHTNGEPSRTLYNGKG